MFSHQSICKKKEKKECLFLLTHANRLSAQNYTRIRTICSMNKGSMSASCTFKLKIVLSSFTLNSVVTYKFNEAVFEYQTYCIHLCFSPIVASKIIVL